MLNREKGSPPLYYQLKEVLKQEIEEEKYKKGDRAAAAGEVRSKPRYSTPGSQ